MSLNILDFGGDSRGREGDKETDTETQETERKRKTVKGGGGGGGRTGKEERYRDIRETDRSEGGREGRIWSLREAES